MGIVKPLICGVSGRKVHAGDCVRTLVNAGEKDIAGDVRRLAQARNGKAHPMPRLLDRLREHVATASEATSSDSGGSDAGVKGARNHDSETAAPAVKEVAEVPMP